MKTLKQIIQENELSPVVIRDNGKNQGDDWETFFAPNLSEPIRKIKETPEITWWRTESGVILEDNLYNSLLATDIQALKAYRC